MMDLNALSIFAAVVEAGSFTGAARTLGIPKGSVSRKVSGLERTLGVRLLHRTTRKLSLTEVGRTYYEQCRKGLDELETASRLVDEVQSAPKGVLRVSAPTGFGGGGLGNWVEAYLKLYDQAKVELVLSDQYVDLIEQRIDLAFRTGRLRDSSYIARKLGPAQRVLCASPDYLARRGAPESPDDLRYHDGIFYGSSTEGAAWHLSGPDGDISVPIDARVAVDSMGYVMQAAQSGLGVALLPAAMAGPKIKSGRLQRVLNAYATSGQGFYAVYPSNRQLSVNVRAFLDLVVEKIETQAPWRTADA